MAAPSNIITDISADQLAPEEALHHPENYEWKEIQPTNWPFRAVGMTGLRLSCRSCGREVTADACTTSGRLFCRACGTQRFKIQQLVGKKCPGGEEKKTSGGHAPTHGTLTGTQGARGQELPGGQQGGPTTQPAGTKGGKTPPPPAKKTWRRLLFCLLGLLSILAVVIGGPLAVINSVGGSIVKAAGERNMLAARLLLFTCSPHIHAGLDYAICAAVLNRDEDMVKLLKQHGANIDGDDWHSSSLFHALSFGDIYAVHFALEHGADVNKHHALSEVLDMHYYSSRCNLLNLVQLFLQHGADPNDRVKQLGPTMCSLTPFLLAARHAKAEVCELLLKHGANPNARDEKNMTPLHYAADHGLENVCRQLLQKGADTHARNKEGKTPLDLAQGHPAIITLLKQYGATY